jgi:hypothetical protein
METASHPPDATRQAGDGGPRPPGGRWVLRLKRVGMVSLMSVVTMNVWTGSPLMALWIGSRASTAGLPIMAAFAVVGLSMVAISLSLVKVLGVLGAAYDQMVGRKPAVRRQLPWMRSMRGERPHEQGAEYRLTALEKVLVASVMAAVVAFEIWFFFFSGSPIDQRSGRADIQGSITCSGFGCSSGGAAL